MRAETLVYTTDIAGMVCTYREEREGGRERKNVCANIYKWTKLY